MTLNELIKYLEDLREQHGGDTKVCDEPLWGYPFDIKKDCFYLYEFLHEDSGRKGEKVIVIGG